MCDFLQGVLTEQLSDEFALRGIHEIHEIARDDIPILLSESRDRVIHFSCEVFDSERCSGVMRGEIASRHDRCRAAHSDGRIFVLKTLAKTLQQLQIGPASLCLVIKYAKETITVLKQASHSIGIIKVARGCHANFFTLKHICFALEEALKAKVVERLRCCVVQELIECRTSGRSLCEAGEINDRDGIRNCLFCSASTLIDVLNNVCDQERIKCPSQFVRIVSGALGIKHDCHSLAVDVLSLVA